MRKYLLTFSVFYLILLTILFMLLILSCNFGANIGKTKITDNKRPYDFKMKVRVKPPSENMPTGSDRDLTKYREKDSEDESNLFLKVKEKNNEIFVSYIYEEDSKEYIHLFKLKSEKFSGFRKAILNGGSFKCFLNKKSDSNKEEYGTEEEDFVVVKGSGSSAKYVFLDFSYAKYSFAILEDDAKRL